MKPRKNKKHKNPRYFLHENEEMYFDEPDVITVDPDEESTFVAQSDPRGSRMPPAGAPEFAAGLQQTEMTFDEPDVLELDPEDVERSAYETEAQLTTPMGQRGTPNLINRLKKLSDDMAARDPVSIAIKKLINLLPDRG